MTAAPVFTDPREPPTPAAVLEAIGPAAPAWNALFDRVRAAHPELTGTWNYYADGKRWLQKVTRGSKTVFWVAVERGRFRVAFYFPERLAGALLASGISGRLKAAIRASQPIGKLRGVTVTFGSARSVPDVVRLIDLKKTLK